MRLVLIGVLLMICNYAMCFAIGKKEIEFPPTTITVLDNENGLPLQGFVVKVINITYYSKPKSLFLESENVYSYRLYSFITNPEGNVELPRFAYKIKRNHHIYKQIISINLDLVDKTLNEKEQGNIFSANAIFYRDDNRLFYRPISKYKSFLHISMPHPTPEMHYYQLPRTQPYMTIVYNGNNTVSSWNDFSSYSICRLEKLEILLESVVSEN